MILPTYFPVDGTQDPGLIGDGGSIALWPILSYTIVLI